MDLAEGSPPYIHTRHLSTIQQDRCELNPTYVENLNALRALRQQIKERTSLISAYESSQVVEHTGLSKKPLVQEPKEIERYRQEREDLEKSFHEWNDELALLAEALVARPKVSCDSNLALLYS